MREAFIVVYGQPKSKGRPRFARGRAYTPASTLQYERLVAAAARGDIMPTRPDIDNVIKIILDGLNGAAYLDDEQVHMVSAEKTYGDEPRVEIKLNW